MGKFTDLPREIRNAVYANCLKIPGGLLLATANLITTNGNPKEGVVLDTQSFNTHQTQLDDALEAFKGLQSISKQLAGEALEEFRLINSVTVRIYRSGMPTYSENATIPSFILTRFSRIVLTSPRSTGHWPINGGGPDLSLSITTKPPREASWLAQDPGSQGTLS